MKALLAAAAIVVALAPHARADEPRWWTLDWEHNQCVGSHGTPEDWRKTVDHPGTGFYGAPEITIKRSDAGEVQMVWIDSHRISLEVYSAVFTRTFEMCEDVRKDMIAIGRIIKPEDLR